MAERVVDGLEAVEVEEEHRGAAARPAPARAAQRLLEPVEEQRAVGQAGERVVQRVVLEALDRAAVVDGVAQRALQRVRVETRPRQVVDRARTLARRPTASASLGSPSTITCARGSSSSSARTVASPASSGVEQHGVVRVLRQRGERPRATLVTHCTSTAAAVEQLADEMARRLGGDDEQGEGGCSHVRIRTVRAPSNRSNEPFGQLADVFRTQPRGRGAG